MTDSREALPREPLCTAEGCGGEAVEGFIFEATDPTEYACVKHLAQAEAAWEAACRERGMVGLRTVTIPAWMAPR